MYPEQYPPTQEEYQRMIERKRKLEEIAEIMHDEIFDLLKEEMVTMSKRIIQLHNELKLMTATQESMRRDFEKEAMRKAMLYIDEQKKKPKKEAKKKEENEKIEQVVQEQEKETQKVKLVGNKYILEKEEAEDEVREEEQAREEVYKKEEVEEMEQL